MFAGNNAVVNWLNVTKLQKAKTDWVSVPGRDFHSLTFRLGGKVLFRTEDETLSSGINTVTFMPRGVSYETEICSPMDMLVIHFRTAEPLADCRPMVFKPSYPVVLRNLFLSLTDRYSVGMERDYVCMSVLYEILAEITEEKTAEHGEKKAVPKRMLEAREYLDLHFSEEISIAALAEKADVSETYFRREFRKHFQLAPAAYLKRIRLERARILLDTGLYTVSETAVRCGFYSASYFSREFTGKYGLTPREYQKNRKL